MIIQLGVLGNRKSHNQSKSLLKNADRF